MWTLPRGKEPTDAYIIGNTQSGPREPEVSDAKLEEIKNNFEFFDKDKNGAIDFLEFRDLLKTISPESNLQQAGEGFSMIDKNSDGLIDVDEFIEWWKSGWWDY